MRTHESLVEVNKITEFRKGQIYKTQFLEYRWVPIDKVERQQGDLLFCSLSSSYKGPCFRTLINGVVVSQINQ